MAESGLKAFAGERGANQKSIVGLIGGTPLLPLRRVTSTEHARVLIRLESANPTGSMKDRAALAMVRKAALGYRCLLMIDTGIKYLSTEVYKFEGRTDGP